MRPGATAGGVRIAARVAALVSLVVGVPAALWFAVGVPTHLPSELELRTALTGSGEEFERLVVHVLAAVVLLAWVQLVAAVVAATFAARRGRRPRRPKLVAEGLHRLAVHLVSGLTVASVLAPTAVGGAAVPDVAVSADDVPVPDAAVTPRRHAGAASASGSTTPGASAMHAAEPPGAAPRATYVVRPGDHLWSIAARIAGVDGPASNEEIARIWAELIETNRHRLHDPSNPSLVHPGLLLILPDTSAVGHEPPLGGGVAAHADEEARGGHGAGDEGGGVSSVPSVPPVLRPEGAGDEGGGVSSVPSVPPVLRPEGAGDEAMSTPSGDPPVLEPPVAPTDAGPASPDVAASGLGPAVTARFGPGGRVGDAAGGAAVAILAATVVRHLRRRGIRHVDRPRIPDGAPAQDTETLEDLEALAAVPQVADDLTAVLSGLRREAPHARVFGFAIAETTTVLLSAPLEQAPDGVEVRDSGWSWLIADEALGRFRAAPPEPVEGALVSLGGHDVGGTLLVDLLALGHLRLSGDRSDVEEVAAAMLLELAAAPPERSPAVHLVARRSVPGVTTHPSLAALLDTDPDGVAVDLTSDDPAELDRLDTSDVAAVTTNGRARWVLEVHPEHVVLEPLGVELARIDPPSDRTVGRAEGDDTGRGGLDRLCRLAGSPGPSALAAVSTPAGTTADAEPAQTCGSLPLIAPVAPLFVESRQVARGDGRVQVKVLGVVEVVGAAGRFTSATALELVTYLAFHRDGADADQLQRWIWPADRPPGRRALVNAVWRARRALGRGRDGEDLLLRAGADGVYRLSDRATTDFDAASAAIAAANEATGDEAVELLRSALELVRGAPFGGGRFAWADHGVRAHVEYVLDEAAHRLADAALGMGDVELARWSTLQGLRVVPGCGQCYRRRLLVADAAGNATELRTVMAELRRIADDEGDEVTADLVELYDDLRRSGVA